MVLITHSNANVLIPKYTSLRLGNEDDPSQVKCWSGRIPFPRFGQEHQVKFLCHCSFIECDRIQRF